MMHFASIPWRQLLLDSVYFLMYSEHERVKVNAFLLPHVVAGDEEKIHEHRFAAANGSPDVNAFGHGRIVKG